MRSETLKKILEETPQSVNDKVARYGFVMNLLKEYTDYLLKNGYCDTDVYSESPTSIDDFMSGREFFTDDIYIQVKHGKQYAGLSLTLDQAEGLAKYILGHVKNARKH